MYDSSIHEQNVSENLLLALHLVDEGNEKEARRIIYKYRLNSNNTAQTHAGYAALCERLGMASPALESWQKAISLDNTNADYFYHTGLLFSEAGSFEKAVKFLKKALEKHRDHKAAKNLLSGIYEMLGQSGAARTLHRGNSHQGKNSKLNFQPRITLEQLHRMLFLFKGEEMGYAEQVIDQTGSENFVYRDHQLSNSLLMDHVLGRVSLAVYPLRKDDSLRFAVIHVRANPRRIFENIKRKSFQSMVDDKIKDYSLQIVTLCRNLDVPAYPENIVDHNKRIWFFFDGFVQNQFAKKFFEQILNRLPAHSSDLQTEIDIGYHLSAAGWEKTPLLLPLGVNKKTDQRCFFVDKDDNIIEEQIDYIHKIRNIRTESAKTYLRSAYRGLRDSSDSFAEQTGGIGKLTDGCAVCAELINKARAGRGLSENEKIVVYHTIGFFEDNDGAIHYALEMTPDYRPEKVDKVVSQLSKNPVSCPKIRELLPELTSYVKCDCTLDIPEGGYPSPLIYLNPKLLEGKRRDKMRSPESLQEAARRYIMLRREIKDLNKTAERFEGFILSEMNKKKIIEIKTPFGLLGREDNGLVVKEEGAKG